MTRIVTLSGIIIFFFLISGCRSGGDVITIDDSSGVLGETNAPVSAEVKLNASALEAADENLLAIMEITGDNDNPLIPVQVTAGVTDTALHTLVFLMPAGEKGSRKFKLVEAESPYVPLFLQKNQDGQYLMGENGEKVLQYNYQTVYEDDVVRDEKEKEEEYIRNERDTFTVTSIYAVPRSDYIHPLYGLEEEMLTRDWPSEGHPHHRGIFWAWPEVYYGSEMGDIYALQRVFARPVGIVETVAGPVYAQINAENLWMWEDEEPIVREKAEITVYRAAEETRVIDLTLRFLALKDSITLATRYTDSYGGLNIRMQTPDEQDISYHTDSASADPQRAWSDFSGIFEGNPSKSGLMVLQNKNNPEYPGTWVEYPDLAWVQPTFPTPGTRYALGMEEPLVLKYRLIIHKGGKTDAGLARRRWDAYHADPGL